MEAAVYGDISWLQVILNILPANMASNVGPASQTVAQHWENIGSTYRVCCVYIHIAEIPEMHNTRLSIIHFWWYTGDVDTITRIPANTIEEFTQMWIIIKIIIIMFIIWNLHIHITYIIVYNRKWGVEKILPYNAKRQYLFLNKCYDTLLAYSDKL